MKTYLINLDRSPERLEFFMSQAVQLGVEVVRIQAVDGSQLPVAELERIGSFAQENRKLTPGEIGCFLSHRKVWEIILNGSDEWAFVAEDDIHLSRDAAKFLNTSGWIPAEADIVKADTNLLRQKFSYRVFGRHHGRKLRRLLSHHDRTGGYFVSKGACEKLLAYTERFSVPVDIAMFTCQNEIYHDLNVVQIIPAVCIQDILLSEQSGVRNNFGSVIDADMLRFAKVVPRKLTAAGKLWRETKRIGAQAVDLAWRAKLFLARDAIFQKVPFTK